MSENITTPSRNDKNESFSEKLGGFSEILYKNNASSSNGLADSSRVPLLFNRSAPLVSVEDDDDLDDREVVSKPYPGVDDGFFTNEKDDKDVPPDTGDDPDAERIPLKPRDPEPTDDHHPELTPRLGPDGGTDGEDQPPDEVDGKQPQPPARRFPFSPGFGPGGFWDVEVGSNPDPDSLPDVNVYQHKKTLAQGMMDLALFSANANQLRYVLESYQKHPYYYPSLGLISVSLILQVAVGIGLIWNATYNVKNEREICFANRINNFTVIGIFLVTVVNVFISAFGVANISTPS